MKHRGIIKGALLAPVAALLVVGCDPQTAGETSSDIASPEEARGLITRLQRDYVRPVQQPDAIGVELDGRFLPPSAAARFVREEGGLRPELATGELSSRSVLPLRADGVMRLAGDAGVAVDVRLEGTAPVEVIESDGYTIHPAAFGHDGTLIHQVRADGVEDYVLFEEAPEKEQLRYTVELSDEIAGLRLVENTLEFLDAGGAPRLRVSPPEAMGSDRQVTDLDLSVEGCAVDRSPAAPWGRATTAPGSRRCVVKVSWEGRALAYPALIDPPWVTTGSMNQARAWHRSSALDSKTALVSGGFDAAGLPLKSAELYNATTQTWAVTGSMQSARAVHTQVTMVSGASAVALVASGKQIGNPVKTSEEYNRASGTWGTVRNLITPRYAHAASTCSSTRFVVTGGYSISNALTNKAEYYDLVTHSWVAHPPMNIARAYHAAANHGSDKFIVTGGEVGQGGVTNRTELSSGCGNFWSGANMNSPRAHHTATAFVVPTTNPHVIVTGGTSGTAAQATTEAYFNGTWASGTPGSWSTTPTMSFARMDHTATLLPADEVLVVGGIDATGASQGKVERFDQVSFAWALQGSVFKRFAHIAEYLSGGTPNNLAAGHVIVAGGYALPGPVPLTSSEAY